MQFSFIISLHHCTKLDLYLFVQEVSTAGFAHSMGVDRAYALLIPGIWHPHMWGGGLI